MDHGGYTGKMGRRLYEKYAQSVHQVYYDHCQDRSKEPNSCQPTPFFDELSSATTLSHVDIAIVDQQTKTIELVAEIEEAGHEPKKIIGDIVSLLMADHVRIKGKDYDFGGSVLVLGARVDEKGSGRKKVRAICRKLTDMGERMGKREMQIVPILHDELERLVEEVEAEIDRWLRLHEGVSGSPSRNLDVGE